jgi:hypothetical protein
MAQWLERTADFRDRPECRGLPERKRIQRYRIEARTGKILGRITAVEAHKNFDPATLPLIDTSVNAP